ncbi:MAG: divalent-cation tolerance protein CutA [Deltaproteobacteria bacterium]|nr:divalent-cation tolerance protein CutA [Deltaproteobacteria bacterium]MDZ4224292.1 divalent-cation tolerance protein CutA [bacterium]
MDNFVVCFSTIDSEKEALKIARALVESHLAACVNIVPKVTSVYEWKEEICEETELLLIIKTQQARLKELKAALEDLHPYDVPEFIALPITDGLPDYLGWILANTK